MLGCALDSIITGQNIRLNLVLYYSAGNISVAALEKKATSSLFSVHFAAHQGIGARRVSEPW